MASSTKIRPLVSSEMTVSISARQGLRIGIFLIWQSLVAMVRKRGSVTFVATEEK